LWSVDGGRELVCRLTEETMKAVGSSELGLLVEEGGLLLAGLRR
jgi:hypothetical protein